MEIINESQFSTSIASGVVLVDFFANWCGPCKMLSPILEELASEVEQVKFVKVDVDESPNLASKYGVQAIPNLIIFKDGHAVDQITGFTGKDDIKKRLDAIL